MLSHILNIAWCYRIGTYRAQPFNKLNNLRNKYNDLEREYYDFVFVVVLLVLHSSYSNGTNHKLYPNSGLAVRHTLFVNHFTNTCVVKNNDILIYL